MDLLESKLATSSVRADEDDGVEEDVAEDRGNAEEREGTPGPMHRRLSIASLGGSGSFVKVCLFASFVSSIFLV